MKKESYRETFKKSFDDSSVKENGTIKIVSNEKVNQKLVIASSEDSLNNLKELIK